MKHLAYELLIPGQCPSGKNSIQTTRTGHRYPKKRFVDWRDAAVLTAVRAIPKGTVGPLFKKPLPLVIMVSYVPGDGRRRDAPGMLDAIFHVLERAGVVEDDAQIQYVAWTTSPIDRESPSVSLVLQKGKP